MNYRDFLQKLIYKLINPLISGLVKLHITPNIITFIGLLLNILAAALFVYAAIEKSTSDAICAVICALQKVQISLCAAALA